jgi:protocatechuate 3,4-dioxygenase beta subunit
MKRQRLLPLLLLALALPATAAVTGTIVRPDGSPVGNAHVTALRPAAKLDWEAGLLAAPEASLATAVTDAKGAFSLGVEGQGLVLLRVEADGFAPLHALVPMDEDAGRIALHAAPTAEGHVTAAGKPVAGAEVVVFGKDGVPVLYSTDANGIYRIPEPRDWAAAIVVRHGDYAASVNQPDRRDFALVSGRAIDGRVVDANAKPVSGARVVFNALAVTTSAADGTFHFAHAAVSRGGWIRVQTENGIGMTQLAGGSTTVKLQPVSKIRGVVRDAEKHPLSGIGILATGMESGDATVSRGDGTFTLSVPRGAYGLMDAGDDVYDFQKDVNTTSGDARVEVIATRKPSVKGVVHDADGNPVTFASVNLQFTAPDGESVRVTRVLTDETGQFRLRFQLADGVTVRAMAMKPGLPSGLSAPLDAKVQSITITLPRGVALAGRVVDANGQPLGGVAVTPAIGMMSAEGVPMVPVESWATTGEDGRFAGRMGEGSMAFSFTKKGYVDSQRAVTVSTEMKPLELTLVPAVHLAGRVVRKDGVPVAEMEVLVDRAAVVSGADGSFRVDGLAAGEKVVRFGSRLEQQQRVTAPADDVKLVMPGIRTIHGRVIDGATRTPVQTFVIFGGAESEGGAHPFESATGEFTLELPETATTIGAVAEGYAAMTKIDPATDPLVIPLAHGRTIRGHVVDEKGQPLGGVRFFNTSELHGDEDATQTQSAGDGSYELTGLGFDTDVQVSFRKDGFVPTRDRVKAGHDDVTLDVTMRQGTPVTGRVVDRTGAGVPAVSVTASSAGLGAEQQSVQTGEGGEFSFAALQPARWDFTAERERGGERGVVKDIDVEKVHELTIKLEPMPVSTIFGQVSGLDPSWTMRFVTIISLGGTSRTAPIDASGNYRIENAPAGTVTVSAMAGASGMSHQLKDVSAEVAAGSETRIDLAYLPQVAVHGRVTRGGAPLEGAAIRFGYSAADETVSGAGGTYTLRVDPGEYDVSLVLNGRNLPFEQHVVITGPAEVNLAVDVATIAVMVLDDASRPLPGARVTAAPHGRTHTAAETVTGADGTAVLEVGGGETDTIVAALQGYGNASQDVAASGTSSVTLHLVRSAGAIVRLVDVRDGRTLAGYAIARDAAGRVLASADEPEADGTMILPVPPGTYRFSASAENYGSHTIQAEVPSGEIRLALPRGGTLALHAHGDLHATAALIQPNGEEYVRCWCSGVADITINSANTLVDQIAPGAYTLEVTPTGGKPRRYPVTVQEGVTTTVSID